MRGAGGRLARARRHPCSRAGDGPRPAPVPFCAVTTNAWASLPSLKAPPAAQSPGAARDRCDVGFPAGVRGPRPGDQHDLAPDPVMLADHERLGPAGASEEAAAGAAIARRRARDGEDLAIGVRSEASGTPRGLALCPRCRLARQQPASCRAAAGARRPADGTVARRCARHRADCQVCAPAARPRPAARAARRPASPAATGARGRSAARCRSRAPKAVPPEFRPACGHPGAHVTVRQVPVTVRHAACDLTGVALSYPGHGGGTVPRTPGGIGNSKGFRLSVDPCTLDVTIEVTGSPAGPRQSR